MTKEDLLNGRERPKNDVSPTIKEILRMTMLLQEIQMDTMTERKKMNDSRTKIYNFTLHSNRLKAEREELLLTLKE